MTVATWRTCVVLILGLLITGGISAQEAEPVAESEQAAETEEAAEPQARRGTVIEEVVVVAQKREQLLQDVGISVSAFSQTQMESFGFVTSTDITAQIPNAQFLSLWGPSGPINLVIRGVGMSDYNNGFEAPVTAYSDEFYLMSTSTVDILMFDLDRTEVLRGPQGTLFGRNAAGGLFHFISAKPTHEFEARASLTYAEFDELRAEAVVSGPFSDRVRGRLSALAVKVSEGFQENANPGLPRGDQVENWGVRAQLEFDLADNFLARVKWEHSEVDNLHPYWEQKPAFVDPETGLHHDLPADVDWYGTGPGNDLFGFRDDGTPNRSHAGQENTLSSTSDVVQLTLQWDTDAFTMTSLTGYMDYSDFKDNPDLDGNPITGITALGLGDWNGLRMGYATDYLTQELRFNGSTSKTAWTAGLYYLDQHHGDDDGRMTIYGAQDFVDFGFLDQPFPLRGAFEWEMDSQALAVFGQVEVNLSDQVGLTVGARVSDEEKDFYQDYQISDPFDILGIGWTADFTSVPPWPYTGRLEDTLYTGKLQLDWRPGDDHLLYVSISRGQKVGSFNSGQVPFILEENVPYDSEKLLAYEIGWKGTFGGGRTRLNMSTFYYDYKDYQTQSFRGLASVVGNNDAVLSGGEIEFSSMPVGNLELSLGASFLNSTVYDVSTGVIVQDMEMPSAPDYQFNGMIRYTWDIGRNAIVAQADFTNSDEFYTGVINHPTLLLAGYTRANARLAFGAQDRAWQLALWVRNFTNDLTYTTAFPLADFFGMTQLMAPRPRQFGATLDFRF